ncbi:hypothetical protein [Epilithonimonas sp.]|uniref:hypothetical protein n=1 Tax=Epilithonimonas sp. TaxID=2894511 RepID=UPI0028AE2478|nr:hypothetical protein [Epilithonimonas sp.]
MKKNLFPFPEKVKSCASILLKCWHLSFLLTFFSFFTLSAQKILVDSLATANITVVGDAYIYSKDEAFNEQISNNKNLQQYSKVIKSKDNEIRISAKNSDVQASTKQNFERAKPEKKLLVSKKKTIDISDLPEKEIPLKISNGLDGTRFLTGNALANIPFISPSNDYYNAKQCIINYCNDCSSLLEFLYLSNFLLTHNINRLQNKVAAFSVRPPPQI